MWNRQAGHYRDHESASRKKQDPQSRFERDRQCGLSELQAGTDSKAPLPKEHFPESTDNLLSALTTRPWPQETFQLFLLAAFAQARATRVHEIATEPSTSFLPNQADGSHSDATW